MFAATGLSVVIHPLSPMVPTAHMNVRMLIRRGDAALVRRAEDLTPHYLFEEDCVHFHRGCATPASGTSRGSHARLKRAADAYSTFATAASTAGWAGISSRTRAGRSRASRVREGRRGRVRDGVPAHRRAAPGPALGRGRATVAGDPPRPLRGVQPRPRPRDGVRPRDRRARRVDPLSLPRASAGLRPRAGGGEPRGGAARGAARAARLAVSAVRGGGRVAPPISRRTAAARATAGRGLAHRHASPLA